MHHILQPDHSRTCGQIAVAVLADTTVERVIEVVGHRRATKTRELVRALRMLGQLCADRMQRQPVERGLVQLHNDKAGWHWIAIGGGLIYDGVRSEPMPYDVYVRFQAKVYGGRLTSFLPVREIY